jgi:hypothetical protein
LCVAHLQEAVRVDLARKATSLSGLNINVIALTAVGGSVKTNYATSQPPSSRLHQTIPQLTSAGPGVGLDVEASVGPGKGVVQALVILLEYSVLDPRLLAAVAAVEADVADESLALLEGGGCGSDSWSRLYAGGREGGDEGDDVGELHDG